MGALVLVAGIVSIDEATYEPLMQNKHVSLQIQDVITVEAAADYFRRPFFLGHTMCDDLMVCDDFNSSTSVVVLLGYYEDQVQASYVEKREDGFQKNTLNFGKQSVHHGFE